MFCFSINSFAWDNKFKSIAIHYSHLDEWVNISGLRRFSHDDGEITIKYKSPDTIKAQINDDYTIGITFKAKFNWSRVPKEISIKEKTCIKIEASEEKPFEELMEMSHRIQQFLSLAMGEPVHPLDIKGVTETEDERSAERVYNPPVDIFSRIPFFDPVTRRLHPDDILFTFREVSDRFGSMLRNWIDKSELFEPVYNLYFGTLYQPDMYLELEFLSLMQAIETFHRRKYGGKYMSDEDYTKVHSVLKSAIPDYLEDDHKKSLKSRLEYGNELSLRTRLKKIFKEYQENLKMFIHDEKRFIDKVVDTRNYFTHYDPGSKRKKVVMELEELYLLTQKLKRIVEICLLRELDFEPEEIERISSRCRRYQISRYK